MKGIILAGGKGTRLRPLTHITNKHLLPVYDRPMIDYPLQTLIDMGIDDILIVSGKDHCGHFMQYLGNGRMEGGREIKFSYRIQAEAGGIAEALLLARGFVLPYEKMAVILGDNIFEEIPMEPINRFREWSSDSALLFSKEVDDPTRFGVYEKSLERIIEKPKATTSKFAITGLYLYPYNVFNFITTLTPSARGELEITDVNNWYIKEKRIGIYKLDGFWSDAGTFESLYRSAEFVRAFRNKKVENNNITTGNG